MDQAQVDWCKYTIPDQWRGAGGFVGNPKLSLSHNNLKQGTNNTSRPAIGLLFGDCSLVKKLSLP